MWKGFFLGVVVTLIVIAFGAHVVMHNGLVDTRADMGRTWYDPTLAHAMDAAVARHTPKGPSPIATTPQTLHDGEISYAMSCAGCHGSSDHPKSEIGDSFNPPAPQFFGEDPADKPPAQNFYIIKHGIRMTGMPAWGKQLSDDDIWKIADYLAQENAKHASGSSTGGKP